MSAFFLQVVNMSISASWIVLAVLLLRLLLKKAPKWITVLLWAIVAVRLICPFSIESAMSLIPSAQTISPDILLEQTPEIDTGFPIVNNVVNPIIDESLSPEPGASVNPLQIWIPILSLVWVLGIVGMLLYTVVSYIRVKRKIGTAVLFGDNIFQSENVVSPFVLGIIRPKIYLPFNMNERDTEHVIAHEQAHISRKDHLWKPLGFLILTLHWFNPLMWLGYVLLCRDIELACDEKVVKNLENEQKADYSQALLTCSVNRRIIAACPLAFGEVGVKDRVKSVLNYKKPAFWIILIAVVASVVAAVCFLTNPISSNEMQMLLNVLNNERTFINESGESVYLKEHKLFSLIDAIPEKYALVDFDGDGKDELVVHITPGGGAYIVFHVDKNKVYGFDFWERELVSLKEDGTFVQSGGAGLNSFAAMQFRKDTYQILEQAYADDFATVYRVNGASSTAEIANAYIAEFYNKPDVSWKEYEIVFRASNTAFPNLKITVTLDTEKQAVTALTVFDEKTNEKIQNINLNENDMFSNKVIYFKDINFDGEDDLIIPQSSTAAAAYYSAYIWDTAIHQFVYAPTFEKLSNVALDADKKVILSSKSADKITSYSISIFDPHIKDFIVQRTLYYYPDGENMVYTEECLENGEMRIIAQFTKPIKNDDYYAMDSALYEYYSNHWNLSSPLWENYLIPNDSNNYSFLYMRFLRGEKTALDENAVAKLFEEYLLMASNAEEYTYTYFDMTGDGIPELCVDTVPEMYFFTIKNGELHHWYTEHNANSKLLNNGAFLMERHGAAPEHINYEYYELDANAKAQFSISFSWWEKETVDGKEYPAFYEINGQEVSKREYEEKTQKYLAVGEDKIVWYTKQHQKVQSDDGLSQDTQKRTDCEIIELTSKTEFEEDIVFEWRGESITVEKPKFLGLKIDEVYSYKAFYAFNNDGLESIKYGDTYMTVNTNGEIVEYGAQTAVKSDKAREYANLPHGMDGRPVSEKTMIRQTGEPGNYKQQLCTYDGQPLSGYFDSIGYFYNGLALVQEDFKLGIIDETGTLLLEPTISFDKITYPPTERYFYVSYMDRDAFIIPIGGELAVIHITRQ